MSSEDASGNDISRRGNHRHRTKARGEYSFNASGYYVKAPNCALVNGRLQFVGIPLQQGTLDLGVFVYNLFDKTYRIQGIDFGAALGWAVSGYGAPRPFCLQLTHNLSAS